MFKNTILKIIFGGFSDPRYVQPHNSQMEAFNPWGFTIPQDTIMAIVYKVYTYDSNI